jgi:hypothetical protein
MQTEEKHLDTAFEHYNPQQLDECLVHFFMDVRKSDGERYRTTLLSCIFTKPIFKNTECQIELYFEALMEFWKTDIKRNTIFFCKLHL